MLPLRPHPFPVVAHFERSLVLTYALPREVLQPHIAPLLTLDTYADRWAFVAVALVKTRGLRPAGVPVWLGRNFFLAGYRIFVRYRTKAGRNLRGLYILRSETDSRLMTLMGNALTHYNYSHVTIREAEADGRYRVESATRGWRVAVDLAHPAPDLPPDSPFPDWAAARRYAGPLPFTFTAVNDGRDILIVEGRRSGWQPRPVQVLEAEVPWLSEQGWGDARLANAFVVEDIPYRWEKGRRG